MFAAGYAACLIGAIRFLALGERIVAAPDTSIDSSTGIGRMAGRFPTQRELSLAPPGVPRKLAERLGAETPEAGPYSNATRSNIDVKLTVR